MIHYGGMILKILHEYLKKFLVSFGWFLVQKVGISVKIF